MNTYIDLTLIPRDELKKKFSNEKIEKNKIVASMIITRKLSKEKLEDNENYKVENINHISNFLLNKNAYYETN